MRKIFTFLLSLIALTAVSQPTLTSSEMAPFGSEFYYKHVATFAAIDTTIQGANQTWNFASVTTTTDPDFTVTIFDPSLTTHASTFPTSNYGTLEGPGMDYNFLVLSSNQYERIGGWNATDGYSIYTNSQIEFKFPFTSTSSWSDTSYVTGNFSDNYFYCTSLGYGTINVPGHTYNDVIMSRVLLDIGILQLEEYLWYSTTTGQPVFIYIPGDGGLIPEAAIFLYNTSIGINENEFIAGLQYNNPVISELHVAYVSKEAISTEYEIMNSLGEVIRKGTLDKSTMQNFSIDLSNEQAGIYLLTLKDADDHQKVKTVKLIKM